MEAKQPTTDLNPEKLIAAGLPLNAVSVDFGHRTQRFFAKMPFGLPKELWTDSRVWKRVCTKFTDSAFDTIICVDEGLNHWSELLVVDIDKRRLETRLIELLSVELPPRHRSVLASSARHC